jgi:hypothetical protein
MDPVSLALGLGGLALKGASFFGGMGASEEYNAAQRQIRMYEQQAENERRKQMELNARRQQLEVVRNAQRMRALSTSRVTNQGGGVMQNSASSGFFGGQAQISGDANYNLLGIGQNLEIGRNMFNINSLIGDARLQASEARSDMQFWDSLGGLGGDMISMISPMKQLTGLK